MKETDFIEAIFAIIAGVAIGLIYMLYTTL